MRITADDRLLLVLNQTLAVIMVLKVYTELFVVDVVVDVVVAVVVVSCLILILLFLTL